MPATVESVQAAFAEAKKTEGALLKAGGVFLRRTVADDLELIVEKQTLEHLRVQKIRKATEQQREMLRADYRSKLAGIIHMHIQDPLHLELSLIVKQSRELIGSCSLTLQGTVEEGPEIGMWTYYGPDRGKGFGSPALKALLEYAKNVLQVPRVWGAVKTENLGSRRFCERHGLVYRGTGPYKSKLIGGTSAGEQHVFDIHFPENAAGPSADTQTGD